MTLNGLAEERATGQVVAVGLGWPTVLPMSAADLPQTAGLGTEETIAVTHDETTLIPTFHLRVLGPTEIEVDRQELTASVHAAQ